MELNNLNLQEHIITDDGERYIVSTVLLVDGSAYETVVFRVGEDNRIGNHCIVCRCEYSTVAKASFGHRAVSLAIQSGIRPKDIMVVFLTDEEKTQMVALEPSAETCAIVEAEIKRLADAVKSGIAAADKPEYKVGDRVVARLLGYGRGRVGTIGYVSQPDKDGRIYYNVDCDNGSAIACTASWLRPHKPDKPN